MSNLQTRQSKIQAKRKQTPWRDFVMEICSWYPVNLVRREKNLISRYPNDRISKVVSIMEYEDGMDSNICNNEVGNSFFMSLQAFFLCSVHPNLHQEINSENANYTDCSGDIKNAYLSFLASGSENVLHSFSVKTNNHDIFDSSFVWSNNNVIYSSVFVQNSSKIFYSRSIDHSSHIYFSQNLIGCHHCIMCHDLTNVSYCISNIVMTQEEFEIKKSNILHQKMQFEGWYHRLDANMQNIATEESIGTGLSNCVEVKQSHICNEIHIGNNILFTGGNTKKEQYFDIFAGGKGNHCYGNVHNAGAEHAYNCISCYFSSNMYYCYYTVNCSFCLGCIGLKNKSYCILNKQYSKEEWYEKVDEIFGQMERDGTLGEFFPATMNPFYFNDTAAYLIDPSFTREEVIAKGYLWRDEAIKVDIPADAEVISTDSLDHYEGYDSTGKRTIDPSILKKVIQDPQGNVYKIQKMEYDFLIKHGLPLPRKHWLDRIKENFRIG